MHHTQLRAACDRVRSLSLLGVVVFLKHQFL